MWLLDFNLSIAVAVGFIALAGVAAETGVVMVLYLDQAWEEACRRAGGSSDRRTVGPALSDLLTAIESGAVNRLRLN